MVFPFATLVWMIGVFLVGVIYALFALYWSVTPKRDD